MPQESLWGACVCFGYFCQTERQGDRETPTQPGRFLILFQGLMRSPSLENSINCLLTDHQLTHTTQLNSFAKFPLRDCRHGTTRMLSSPSVLVINKPRKTTFLHNYQVYNKISHHGYTGWTCLGSFLKIKSCYAIVAMATTRLLLSRSICSYDR